ncbi:hypothetical protein [Nocardia sp. NPDC050406]|uniref:hypothetical protein n=1 Tax=Nocardia sp. NPDC050406 TaxID=3364318 RepID=UPI0037963698
MPLTSAAICPHPPGLIPAVAGPAAAEWDRSRTACLESVRRLNIPQLGVDANGRAVPATHDEPTPDLLVVVGGDETTRTFDSSGAYASLRQAGIDWQFGWEGSGEPQPLPLTLSLGYWLLITGTPPGMILIDIVFQAISYDATPEECLALGKDLAGRTDNVAMLVLGEGSAVRGVTTRPHPDSAAATFDAKIAQALAEADTTTLGQLTPRESRGFNATGRAAWQVLAGAAGEQRFHATLLESACQGLGHFVASWRQAPVGDRGSGA